MDEVLVSDLIVCVERVLRVDWHLVGTFVKSSNIVVLRIDSVLGQHWHLGCCTDVQWEERVADELLF